MIMIDVEFNILLRCEANIRHGKGYTVVLTVSRQLIRLGTGRRVRTVLAQSSILLSIVQSIL